MYTLKTAIIIEDEEDQSNLLKNIVEFSNKFRPKKQVKDKKGDTCESAYEGPELTFNAFKSEIFPQSNTRKSFENINS